MSSFQSPGPGKLRAEAGFPDLHALQVQDLDGKPLSLAEVTRGRATWAALLVGLVCGPAAWAAALPPVDVSDRPFGANNGRSVSGTIRVAATPHEAFRILADYPRMTEYVPGVAEATVLATRPGWARVRFRIRGGLFVNFTQVEERTTIADQKITWHATEGPLKVSDGSWTLTSAAGGRATDVTYHADLEPSVPIPGSWMGSFVRQGVPDVLQAVRRRIESKGVWRLP